MFGRKPGSFRVNQLTIVNQDKDPVVITNIVSDLKLYEGILHPFIKGRLTVVDSVGILENYKLVGQESLTIDVDSRLEGKSEGANFRKVFRIYAIDNVVGDSVKKTKTYRLHICDPKMMVVKTRRLNKTLRGSYSSMLLQVLQDDAGFRLQRDLNKTADYWEETEPTNLQIVCPGWTIEKFIEVVRSEAVKKSTDNSYAQNMFFYQTMNGSFRFCSFDTMVSELEEPISFDMNTRSDVDVSEVDPDLPGFGEKTEILGMIQPKRADVLQGATSGAFASKQITYDPIRKITEEFVYRITDSFGKSSNSHVSKAPLINPEDMEITYGAKNVTGTGELAFELEEEVVDFAPKDRVESYLKFDVNPTNAFSDEAKLIDTNSKETKTQQLGFEKRNTGDLQRRAMLSSINQNQTNVTVPFRTDLSVGTTVKLNFPTFKVDNEDDTKDELQDNTYLITNIRYHMMPVDNEGALTLTCVKESFAKPVKGHRPLDKIESGVVGEN